MNMPPPWPLGLCIVLDCRPTNRPRRREAASERVALAGESPARRIDGSWRNGPVPVLDALGGESSPGIEPMGLNEDEPQLMSLETTRTGEAEPLRRRRRPMLAVRVTVGRCHLRRGRRGRHVGKASLIKLGGLGR